MQTKRLLDDRDVFAGDRLLDTQGRPYAFLEHLSGELVVADVERQFRFTTREDMK